MTAPDLARADARPNRTAVLAVLAALLLVAASLAATIGRYRMPTDGWALVIDDTVNAQPYFAQPFWPAAGVSALHTGDSLLAIDGQPVTSDQTLVLAAVVTPAGWRDGGQLTYTIRRGGQTLTVLVPLVVRPLSAMPALVARDFPNSLSLLFVAGVLGFVFVRRPGNPAAQVLLVLAAVFVAIWLAGLVADDIGSLLAASFWLGPWKYFRTWVWAGFLFPTLLLFSLVFPRPKRFMLRYAWLVIAGLYGALPLLRLALGNGWQLGWGLVAVFGLLAAVTTVHSFISLRHDPVARAQAKWVLAALVVVVGYQAVFNGLLIIFTAQFTALASQPLFQVFNWLSGNLFTTILPLALAVAITRYRLFDIDVIIRRTLLYSLLTALLALAYLASVLALQSLFSVVTGQSQSTAATVLSTLAIAALFVPLRARLQAFIDRRFFRRKYDAAHILAGFGASLRDDVNLDALTERLLGVVDETMQPAAVDLWLANRGGQ